MTWAGQPFLTVFELYIIQREHTNALPVHVIYEKQNNTANQAKNLEPVSFSYLPYELGLVNNSEPQFLHP